MAQLDCLVLRLSVSGHVFLGVVVVPADSSKGFPYRSTKITQRIKVMELKLIIVLISKSW